MGNDGCIAMYKDKSFSNVCCCSTDLCNSPANVYGCNASGVVNTSPVAPGGGPVTSTNTGKSTTSSSATFNSNLVLGLVVVLGYLFH